MTSPFTDGVQFAWDSTSIKTAEDCLRKYKYRLIDGWQPKRKSVHLLFGGWYAEALEHFYKYRALGDTHDAALIKVVREALINTWVFEDGEPWKSDHNTKTRENLIRTIVWYVEQFHDDPITIIKLSDGKPAIELSFSFEATNGIVLCGHLDRLVEYAGNVYVMDQKTTGSTISSNYFDSYDPDTQMSLYTFAGKIIYHVPVKGVIIDAAQIAVGFSRFARGFTFRDDAKLEEWYDDAMYTINLAQEATRKDYFPMNPSSCHKYAGCEFRQICSRSPHVRDAFLKGDFVKGEPWNPLDKR